MEETVYVAPLGWEHDRVVKPAIEGRVHRVHLLVRLDDPRAEHFLKKAEASLNGAGIETNRVEIEPNREFESTVLNVARLTRREAEEDNRVFVNMSSGGKIAAVASSLAAMYHRDRAGGIYYAKPEHYLVGIDADNGSPDLDFEDHGLTAGYKASRKLPALELKKPSAAGVRTLVEIYRRGPMTLDEILSALHDHGVEPYDDEEVAEIREADRPSEVRAKRRRWVQRLRRSVVDELQALGLVSQTKRGVGGKVHLEVTEDGGYYALASGMVEELRLES